MGVAISFPPPASLDDAQDDAAPLRAKSLGKLRLASRQKARERGAKVFALAARNVSNRELGEQLGGELAGTQARTGALVQTAGEVAFLAPLIVALTVMIDLLSERVAAEMAADRVTPEQLQALKMMSLQLDVLRLHAVSVVS